MRISDWSSDVCSSDLRRARPAPPRSSSGLRTCRHRTPPPPAAAPRRSKKTGRREESWSSAASPAAPPASALVLRVACVDGLQAAQVLEVAVGDLVEVRIRLHRAQQRSEERRVGKGGEKTDKY